MGWKHTLSKISHCLPWRFASELLSQILVSMKSHKLEMGRQYLFVNVRKCFARSKHCGGWEPWRCGVVWNYKSQHKRHTFAMSIDEPNMACNHKRLTILNCVAKCNKLSSKSNIKSIQTLLNICHSRFYSPFRLCSWPPWWPSDKRPQRTHS